MFNYLSKKCKGCRAVVFIAQPYFHDIILSSGVFRFFKKLKSEGCIIILPTSRKENVIGMVDEVIEIGNPRFDNMISQHPYFIEHFQ